MYLKNINTYFLFFGSHAIPEWFDPLTAQYAEYHHEWVEKVVEIPSGSYKIKIEEINKNR